MILSYHFVRAGQLMRSADLDDLQEALSDDTPPPPPPKQAKRAEMQRFPKINFG